MLRNLPKSSHTPFCSLSCIVGIACCADLSARLWRLLCCVQKWVNSVGKAQGRKGKRLFMPMRIAFTGRMQVGGWVMGATFLATCTLLPAGRLLSAKPRRQQGCCCCCCCPCLAAAAQHASGAHRFVISY